jgi:hypothetical protein
LRDIAVGDEAEEMNGDATLLFAPDPDIADIQAWYNEPPMNTPFPDGALLFFNQ